MGSTMSVSGRRPGCWRRIAIVCSVSPHPIPRNIPLPDRGTCLSTPTPTGKLAALVPAFPVGTTPSRPRPGERGRGLARTLARARGRIVGAAASLGALALFAPLPPLSRAAASLTPLTPGTTAPRGLVIPPTAAAIVSRTPAVARGASLFPRRAGARGGTAGARGGGGRGTRPTRRTYHAIQAVFRHAAPAPESSVHLLTRRPPVRREIRAIVLLFTLRAAGEETLRADATLRAAPAATLHAAPAATLRAAPADHTSTAFPRLTRPRTLPGDVAFLPADVAFQHVSPLHELDAANVPQTA